MNHDQHMSKGYHYGKLYQINLMPSMLEFDKYILACTN